MSPLISRTGDKQLAQADELIFLIQPLQVTGKRIPAKEQWLKVLESTKSVAVYTGRAAIAYNEGRIGDGNNEMVIALGFMDTNLDDLETFNAMDLV